jgi:hypothetical protein
MRRLIILFALAICLAIPAQARFLLLPMDGSQSDHLRAYGQAFSMLESKAEVNWLLNYRGGSFLVQEAEGMTDKLLQKGVFFERLKDEATADLLAEILENPLMDAQVLVKAPRIAVYGPMEDDGPWDDAVVNVLEYAGIPYTRIFDREVLDGQLNNYDWLHIHHEDFTGQFGKCYTHFRHQGWYAAMVASSETAAEEYGFATVREMKLAVAISIRTYVNQGGFFFAMCSAADTYEIALAAEGLDFVDEIYDGTPGRKDIADKLNFDNTLAFENFELILNPLVYEHSNIDANFGRQVKEWEDYFTLTEYSATEQPEQSMLCQNHELRLKGFLGQTTGFRASLLKKEVSILGRIPDQDEARYVHGNYGNGAFTFLGGHDPEDYMHFYGEESPDIAAHRNSPGYRLILNNVFYPSARLNQENVLQVRKVEVYPNPIAIGSNQGKFELRFESKEQQKIEISVYNVLHQEIYSKTLDAQIGFTSLPINLRRVVKGIYFLEMRKDDFAIKRKVIVL